MFGIGDRSAHVLNELIKEARHKREALSGMSSQYEGMMFPLLK
jgi:hypothetical protein